MEAVSVTEVFRRQLRREFVETRPAIPQGGGKTVAVFRSGIDPEVNVLGERRRAVEDGGLPADEEILDTAIAKALEKVCDHAPL